MTSKSPVNIQDADLTFEPERLAHPFGFKGGYVSKLWQSVVRLQDDAGNEGVGLGTQSVLWSDPDVFAACTTVGGNLLMLAVTEYALHHASSYNSPIDLLESVAESAHDYARRVTDRPNLRKTFTLNALVPFDLAAWVLFARRHGITAFDELIPSRYRSGLGARHDRIASVPTVGFGATQDALRALADAGYFVIKVKLGHPGSAKEMMERDMRRVQEIHDVYMDRATDHTDSGRILYYLDANGRYNSSDQLARLIDHADKVGALDHILLVEEPFPESMDIDVSEFGVRIAADESAHTDVDVRRLIDRGYGAIALKPIAKTLSMTLKIAALAADHGIPCFCADLTVNPILVDWNKVVAARLDPLPGLQVGLLETNGHQNYTNWRQMTSYHPAHGASWTRADHGVFHLTDDFYAREGGIFETSDHYTGLFSRTDA